MDANTQAQLGLIEEIRAALDAAGAPWWLYGGWAMDAHAGRVTRDHSDIEVFVWASDARAVRSALGAAGFLWVPGLHPDEGDPYLKDGQEVSVTFLARDVQGRLITPGRWSDWPWIEGAFEGPRVRLGQIDVPVTSIAGLLDMKENFAKHLHGRPLRPKDEADIALLRALANQSGD
jgi:hypothetical protein